MQKNLYIARPTAYSVMIKPIGPACNLHCSYCYYLEKEKLYPETKNFRIADNVLEEFIRQNIQSHQVPVVQFVWHGGEPTMLGPDYYRNVIKIQEKYAGDKRIENIIQTNGTLINDDWCQFLKQNNFLVGISIDGPKEIHDTYRTYRNGEPSWDKAMNAIRLFKKHGVEFNTMTVVNNVNSQSPIEIYHFLKNIGSRYMQFIPLVEKIALGEDNEKSLKLIHPGQQVPSEFAPWSVKVVDFGNFLTSIFDEWVRKDVGTYYIQHFDVALANWVGERPGLCVFSETCGDAPSLEFNGDLYTCDHYVFPDHMLGNILETPLEQLVKSEKQITFGENKLKKLPNQCIECDYRFACHGGCPKNRFNKTSAGEAGLNYFCEGYYKFFSHIHPFMQFMADELKHKRAPANVMDWVRKMDIRNSLKGKSPAYPEINQIKNTLQSQKTGRNDPCPCGSGKKFKSCCMNKGIFHKID